VFSTQIFQENTFLETKPNFPLTGKCFPLTNFPNGKQTQKSLENNFPKSEFRKTNITIVNICCFFLVLVVRLELPKMKRKYMDRETCFSWIICRNKLFIWRHLSSSPSKDCVLELPPNCVDAECHRDHATSRGRNKAVRSCKSAGIVMDNQKTQAVIYWSDIYNEAESAPVSSLLSSDELEVTSSLVDGKSTPNRQGQHSRSALNSMRSNSFHSLITSPLQLASMF